MKHIETLDELEALYGAPGARSLHKVRHTLSPVYRKWIEQSRFCILSTVGPEGTDASPRGDVEPVVRIIDDKTIWLPDWMGNNRIDSLRNILRDGRVSLMFFVPGSNTVVRINGRAVLSADPQATGEFEQRGKHPRSVAIITIEELYFQCAKALMRSSLWGGAKPPEDLPSVGHILAEADAEFDAESYDEGYAEYAAPRMW